MCPPFQHFLMHSYLFSCTTPQGLSARGTKMNEKFELSSSIFRPAGLSVLRSVRLNWIRFLFVLFHRSFFFFALVNCFSPTCELDARPNPFHFWIRYLSASLNLLLVASINPGPLKVGLDCGRFVHGLFSSFTPSCLPLRISQKNYTNK